MIPLRGSWGTVNTNGGIMLKKDTHLSAVTKVVSVAGVALLAAVLGLGAYFGVYQGLTSPSAPHGQTAVQRTAGQNNENADIPVAGFVGSANTSTAPRANTPTSVNLGAPTVPLNPGDPGAATRAPANPLSRVSPSEPIWQRYAR